MISHLFNCYWLYYIGWTFAPRYQLSRECLRQRLAVATCPQAAEEAASALASSAPHGVPSFTSG